MFSKGKTHPLAIAVNSVPSIISADLKIIGNLISEGSIEIEGRIEGNVSCSRVTIRREGFVKGDVVAELVQVDGEVSGLVNGKYVNISESGRVSGMVVYESLSIKDGAQIDGQCKSKDRLHHGKVEPISPEELSGGGKKENVAILHSAEKRPQ